MKTTRSTTAKTAVYELIMNSDVALSHSEIQKLAGDLCDRVTIYRILDRLVTEDVIHKIATPDGLVKYAVCQKTERHSHNHIHFSCEKCLSVTCLDTVEPIFEVPENYTIKEVNFTVSGFCPNCS